MGFFNELKSDLSQAVNTILPSEDDAEAADPMPAEAIDPLLAAALAGDVGEEAPQEEVDDGIVIFFKIFCGILQAVYTVLIAL